MTNLPRKQTEELAKQLGHVFKDNTLLDAALTHPSLLASPARKKAGASAYERLEFLGDRVLGLVIARWLYDLFPAAPEGELAKRHAALVNRDALKNVAQALDLHRYLRVTQGEGDKGLRQNLAALSDATEAVIGALYLDGGLPPAEAFIRKYWEGTIHAKTAPADPKTVLQEWAQGRGLPLPAYTIVERTGPAHAPVFTIEVSVTGFAPVKRKGESKREAEKAAAQALYEDIAKA